MPELNASALSKRMLQELAYNGYQSRATVGDRYDASFEKVDDEIRERHGQPWGVKELERLFTHFRAATPLREICEDMQRPATGVLCKLVSMGLVEKDLPHYRGYRLTPRGAMAYGAQQACADQQPQPVTEKETDMSNDTPVIETKTFISGQDAANMSDQQIFNKIADLEKQIEKWSSIKSRPKKLEALIKQLKDDIQKLTEFVDSREGE